MPLQIATKAEIDALTRINVEDVLSGAGLRSNGVLPTLLGWLCRYPARRFARRALAYDQSVGQVGLHRSGSAALHNFRTVPIAVNAERVPRSGPVILAANHPGLADALMVFASVPRSDVRVLAATRSFLQALPHVSRHLIYLDLDRRDGRVRVLRAAADHLRQGGCLLIFPAGSIEPDPDLVPLNAGEAFSNWSGSVDLLVRLVPQTRTVPVLISGVLNRRAQQSLLTRWRAHRTEREWLGATLQLLLPWYRAHAEIRFGMPVSVEAPAAGHSGQRISDSVVAAMREMLGSAPKAAQSASRKSGNGFPPRT